MKIYGRTTIRLQHNLCDAQNFIHTARNHRFDTKFSVVGLLLRQFSKLVVSATHPPLQN